MYDKNNDKVMTRLELTKKSDPELWEDARRSRSHLVDVLSTFDDTLANLIISSESFDITTVDIIKALREVTLKQVKKLIYCFI